LHGSETWPVRKENEVALQQAELRERLGLYDIIQYYSKTGCNGMGMCCEKIG